MDDLATILADPEKLAQSLGGALVNRRTLPEFSFETSQIRGGDMFYALLNCNTSHDNIREDLEGLRLRGSFAGIGFATSLYCVLKFFDDDYRGAFFCEREPYAYLASKVIMRLIEAADSSPNLLLSLLDYDSFFAAFSEVVAREPEVSAVLLRMPRRKLLEALPPEVEQLRRGIFATQHNRLTDRERDLFSRTSRSSISDKLSWIKHFVTYKSYFSTQALYHDFAAVQRKLLGKAVLLNVDMFHPDLWRFFGSFPELWRDPGMFHFANAAVYSADAEIRKEQYCVSCSYGPELLRRIPHAAEGLHIFLSTISKERYAVVSTKTIPTLEDLLETFRKKKKNGAAPKTSSVAVPAAPAPAAPVPSRAAAPQRSAKSVPSSAKPPAPAAPASGPFRLRRSGPLPHAQTRSVKRADD